MSEKRSFRCAIYTRKSTEEGLEQDFNSLHAQREACEAFIKSQAHEGWKLIRQGYDDAGYSGGTMERPGLQVLLDDVKRGQVDVVVVYKIDRLTRSLTDFARIVEVFEAHGASFVSVTQAFNTTTSMGRLTLNVLLSFAQFEREVTAERIRDKIAASKKKGIWMGGTVPLGYEVKDRELIVNEAEAATVRTLFRLYLELGNVRRLKEHIDQLGLTTKRRRSASGTISGGSAFSRGHLYNLLSNPIYVGRIAHRKESYPGRHQAIIDEDTWAAVQERLKANGPGRSRASNATEPSLLTGLVFDETGDRLSPSHAVKRGRRFRYYISHRLMQATRRKRDGWRLPARELERLVMKAVADFLRDKPRLMTGLDLSEFRPDEVHSVLAEADEIAGRLSSGAPPESEGLLRTIIQRIDISPAELKLQLDYAALSQLLTASTRAGGVIEVVLPIALRRRGVEARIVVEDGRMIEGQGSPDPRIIDLLRKAHQALAWLTNGEAESINEVAARSKLEASDVTRILPLSFLAPDLVTAILDGRQPVGVTAKQLKRMSPLPATWEEQRRVLATAGCARQAAHPS
jgi:site-specific DNA recombinase